MDKDTLKKIPLFAALDDAGLSTLAHSVDSPRQLSRGDILCKEKAVGHSMFIVLSGRVEVIKAYRTPDHRSLAVLAPGEFVGELCLILENQQRTATVRAIQPAKILELSRAWFESVMDSHPALSTVIMRRISERLCAADEAIIRSLREKNRELNRAYNRLKNAQAELIEKEKIEQECLMARRIQTGILPRTLTPPEGCDIGARMTPARTVGGDFYDAVPLDDHRTALAIGDVSGKGIPAAIFMAQFCTLLRVWAKPENTPEYVLTQINNHLTGLNDEGLFVTCIYGIYDSRSGTFSYARAGHELPMVIDANGNITRPLKQHGVSLCLFPDPALDIQKLIVPPGGRLLLYVDGCINGRNESGDVLGSNGFEGFINECTAETSQAICDALEKRIREYQNDTPCDDITLVGLHRINWDKGIPH
ncbi:MAG: SpoIIE family protein phosphatase [Desulfobacterales bacterium]|nr:SpoIIE family protein phosphatase [Desulfobacterales bacterium]